MTNHDKNVLIFKYIDVIEHENVELKFEVDPNINIYDLHDLCKRFCTALGYTPTSIKDAFGETL